MTADRRPSLRAIARRRGLDLAELRSFNRFLFAASVHNRIASLATRSTSAQWVFRPSTRGFSSSLHPESRICRKAQTRYFHSYHNTSSRSSLFLLFQFVACIQVVDLCLFCSELPHAALREMREGNRGFDDGYDESSSAEGV